jgi:uncharacterized protein (DUF2141 family)
MRVSVLALLLFALVFGAGACGGAPPHVARPRTVEPGAPLARLRVEVLGVRSRAGRIVLAVYDNADAFPHREQALASVAVAPSGNPTVVEVPGLPEGRYAVVAYHDADGDGSLDTNIVGYPSEPFGFSNDAKLEMFGPPDFDACAFDVKAPLAAIRFSLSP